MNRIKINLIAFEVSSYCGADCVMCEHRNYQNRNKTMSFELFKKTLDEAVKLGAETVAFGVMGDPLLDGNLIEKLKYIKTNYPNVSTRSSSTMHTYNEELFQYIDVMNISNYGLTKETYEKVHRGAVVFEEAQENILKLISLPEGKRPYLHMYYLCLPENSHETEAWKERWEGKVDEIWIWKPHTMGGYIKGYEAVEKRGAPKSCGRPFPPFNDIDIRVDGRVSVCCFDPHLELCIGDVKNSSLLEILSGSQKLKEIQEVHKSCSFFEKDLVCKNCDQIFDRSEALVYTSNPERKTGHIFTKGKSYELHQN